MKANEKMKLIAIVALIIAPFLGFTNKSFSVSTKNLNSRNISGDGVRGSFSDHGAGNSLILKGGSIGGFVDNKLAKFQGGSSAHGKSFGGKEPIGS